MGRSAHPWRITEAWLPDRGVDRLQIRDPARRRPGSVDPFQGKNRGSQSSTRVSTMRPPSLISAYGRFCCKSPKMQATTFPTKRQNKSQTPIDIASRPSPKSPVSSSRDDVPPHMFISTSRLQPGNFMINDKNFMINDKKRLLQQYRP